MAYAQRRHFQPAVRKFKGATVYDWDSEPAAERPSAFVESVWNGTAHPAWARSGRGAVLEVRRPRPARKRGDSAISLALGLVMAVAVAASGLLLLARWLPLH